MEEINRVDLQVKLKHPRFRGLSHNIEVDCEMIIVMMNNYIKNEPANRKFYENCVVSGGYFFKYHNNTFGTKNLADMFPKFYVRCNQGHKIDLFYIKPVRQGDEVATPLFGAQKKYSVNGTNLMIKIRM